MVEEKKRAGCQPTNEGICNCTGAIIMCACGICQKCGRVTK